MSQQKAPSSVSTNQGAVVWLTGLSASGKSTLAQALAEALAGKGFLTYVLDGDQLRQGLNSDLGFGPQARQENIRRVGEVAALFANAGLICISACISPYRADRERARQCCQRPFHEVYVAADLATCEQRDPKGLYRRARAGELTEFTGVSAPYEPPLSPQLVLDTAKESVEDCLQRLLGYLEQHLPARPNFKHSSN